MHLVTTYHLYDNIVSLIIWVQKNYIQENTLERMKLDEEVIMDFFREYISVSVSALHFVHLTIVILKLQIILLV